MLFKPNIKHKIRNVKINLLKNVYSNREVLQKKTVGVIGTFKEIADDIADDILQYQTDCTFIELKANVVGSIIVCSNDNCLEVQTGEIYEAIDVTALCE